MFKLSLRKRLAPFIIIITKEKRAEHEPKAISFARLP